MFQHFYNIFTSIAQPFYFTCNHGLTVYLKDYSTRPRLTYRTANTNATNDNFLKPAQFSEILIGINRSVTLLIVQIFSCGGENGLIYIVVTEVNSTDLLFDHASDSNTLSAKLHYTDTGYGHVVHHHQRTSSQQILQLVVQQIHHQRTKICHIPTS